VLRYLLIILFFFAFTVIGISNNSKVMISDYVIDISEIYELEKNTTNTFFIDVDTLSENNMPKYIKLGKRLIKIPLLSKKEKQSGNRVTAIIVTILTGPLGGHRIYLGTNPVVPVVYSITLGGFFIMPVVDLGFLIGSKDISRFRNNEKIFMWLEPRNK